MNLWRLNGVRWQIWWQTLQLIYRYHFSTLTFFLSLSLSISFFFGRTWKTLTKKKNLSKMMVANGVCEFLDSINHCGRLESQPLQMKSKTCRVFVHDTATVSSLLSTMVTGLFAIINIVSFRNVKQNTQVTCSKMFYNILSCPIKIVFLCRFVFLDFVCLFISADEIYYEKWKSKNDKMLYYCFYEFFAIFFLSFHCFDSIR